MRKLMRWGLLTAICEIIVYLTLSVSYLKHGGRGSLFAVQDQIEDQQLQRASLSDENVLSQAPGNQRHQDSEEKMILFWFVPYGSDRTVPLEYLHEINNVTVNNNDKEIFVDSKICGNCRLAFDRKLISKSDAVVFYAHDVKRRPQDLPQNSLRQKKQLYIWWVQESTAGVPFRTKAVPDFFFNLTMSVRRSSGVHSPYSTLPWILKMLWNKKHGRDIMHFIAKEKDVTLTDPESLNKAIHSVPVNSFGAANTELHQMNAELKTLLNYKKGLVAWIVGNCGNIPSSYLRFEYADLLRKYGLKIDQFGGCSGVPFPVASRWDPSFNEVLSTYKFYLVFENAYHCNGYMTEKLWYNALYSGAVPILFGPHKDDVSAVLPPKSYIHAEDFKTPADLVKYIYYLDKNVTAYAEYLEWRTWVKFLDQNGELLSNVESDENFEQLSKEQRKTILKYLNPTPSGFCGLCRKLHDRHNSDIYTIKSVNDWWEGTVRRECMDIHLARKQLASKKTIYLFLLILVFSQFLFGCLHMTS
ncbi:alpha-(1,3)-fucosyltransferase 4-like [Clavelina lepadiformis]|uniref:alpha-(1,3)-fucosyltransferase 4-like n=1 Tax=Clavelina lepadiformis TaxID=159417 RepID=UPI004042D298